MVPKLGKKAFEQAAGFLRIRGGNEPLDNSAVHPESYPIVERMSKKLGVHAKMLVGNATLSQKLRPKSLSKASLGFPRSVTLSPSLANQVAIREVSFAR